MPGQASAKGLWIERAIPDAPLSARVRHIAQQARTIAIAAPERHFTAGLRHLKQVKQRFAEI
jgi:hypothetical protein